MQTADGGVPGRGRGTLEQLRIGLEPDLKGVRIRLVGDLDLATAPQLDRLLDELGRNGHSRLLIDLTGVEFIDSSGLASILRALLAARDNGHQLSVRRGSRQVQRLFELAGVIDRLPFEDEPS